MRRALIAGMVLAAALAASSLWTCGQGGPLESEDLGDTPMAQAPVRAAKAPRTTAALRGRARGADEREDAPVRRALWVLVEDAADGLPIHGALVEATLIDGSTARASTLPNGLARFEGLGAMPSQVAASADGYVSDFPEWRSRLGDAVSGVLIQLVRARSRPIRVVESETGAAVGGARLIMHRTIWVRMQTYEPLELRGAIHVGTTDAHGCTTLAVRPGASRIVGFILEIQAEGRRTTWWPVDEDAPASREPWVLRIPPGGDLAGRILDTKGCPIADVRLIAMTGNRYACDPCHVGLAWPLDGDMISSEGYAVPLTATTDVDGRYCIAGIGLGEPYGLSARKVGFAPVDVSGLRGGHDAGGIRWDGTLGKEGRLVVRVVDPDHNPIPSVFVTPYPGPRYYSGCGGGDWTDANGTVTFAGLDTGAYSVDLQAKGGLETPQDEFGRALYDETKGWNLAVRQGETTEVALVLPRGAHGDPRRNLDRLPPPLVPVAGVVVDANGRPLHGVVMRDRTGVPLGLTDEHGRFSAEVESWNGVTLGMNGPFATEEVHSPPKDGSALRIVAQPRRLVSLSLRIVRPEGAPSPQAVRVTVEPTWRGGGAGYAQPLPAGTLDVPWPSKESREVWVEREVRSGGLRVTVEAEGYAKISREIQLDTDAGSYSDAWTLERGLLAHGRVVDEAGKPIAGACVVVNGWARDRSAQVSRTGRTNGDGSFEVGGLEPGPWTFEVTHDDYLPLWAPSLRDSKPPSQGVDPERIVLVRGGRVHATVIDPDGLPRVGIRVSLRRTTRSAQEAESAPAWGNSVSEATNIEGTAEFLVAPGSWQVTLPSGYQDVPDLAAPQDAEVKAGETVEVRVRLADA